MEQIKVLRLHYNVDNVTNSKYWDPGNRSRDIPSTIYYDIQLPDEYAEEDSVDNIVLDEKYNIFYTVYESDIYGRGYEGYKSYYILQNMEI